MYICCSGVVILVLCKLLSEDTVHVSQCVHSGVNGPHCGEYLAHQSYIFINGTLAYFLNTRLQEASSDPLGEDMKDGDWVLDVVNVGQFPDPGGEFHHLPQAVFSAWRWDSNTPPVPFPGMQNVNYIFQCLSM